MIPIVPHRMGGSHAVKDPLLMESVGSSKRRRDRDGSDMAYYKETEQERKDRLSKQKKAEKEAQEAQDDGTSSKKTRRADATLSVMNLFKQKLKSSKLPDEAAAAEQKHKDEKEVETKKSLEKLARAEGASSAASSSAPDDDERKTLSQIWQEGDEESAKDWADGGGLKFHTTADKAFSMHSKKFREALEGKDSFDNREAGADRAKKLSEIKMAEFRQNRAAKSGNAR